MNPGYPCRSQFPGSGLRERERACVPRLNLSTHSRSSSVCISTMSGERFAVFLLIVVCLDVSMSFQEVPSYEDRLTFRLYAPHASQTNDTNVLLDLKSVINKIHDPDFLREMAIPRDQKLYQTARLYADNYNVSETCREHWNRTIAGLTRNEFWAIKSKGVKCLSKFYV